MSTLALRAGRLQFFLATILRAVSGGIGLAPNELCGTYEAPACAELTANNSIFLGTRQTLKPNGTFIEEGALALGRCRRSGETGEASIVHYRLSGSFRDHGADTRHKDVNVRKLVIDIQGVVVMPLPGSSALDSWRKVCPCGGRSWKPLEEVDVLSRCGDTCEPFLARSLYLLYSTNEEHSLCISPRRSFDERWPLRQKLTTCLSKESHMECWRREPRRRTTFSPEVTHDRAHFLHMRVPADPLADLQITAIAADVFMKEDGTYSEEMSWVFGQLQQKVHLRTFAAGRWHHHGEHTFVPGMAKLRLELSEVIAHPQTSQVCLEEGCAPPGVILRLICPCGPRVWASDGHAGQDLLQCPSSSCSLSSFFPMESFLLGGRHPNGTMCLSVKNPSRFHGWGMNSSNLLSCSGDASHQETWLPEDGSTEEERLEERTTTSTTALSSSIRAGMDGDPDKSKHDKRMSSDSMRRYPRTFTSPSHDKPDQIQEEQSKVRSHEHAHDHSQAFASSSDGVTAFEEVGLSGKKHFLGVGRHPAKSLPFAAVRSLQIPAGWHVVVLAPLKMQNGRIISDAAQLIRALVFDVVNLTKRIDTARPWVGADGMPALMQQLQFEVRKLDSSNLRGARLSTVACGESDHATADSRLLSLFGEASETFQVHDTLQHWQSISVDHGFRLTVDAKRGEAAMIDIIGSPGLNASCANFTKPPKVIELEPDCSDLDQCSGHGICRRPQECVCRMMEGWIGKSCNLQVPDRTTAVVCNSVLAFVGAPLDCFIHVRRHYEPILAASEVLSVTLSDPLLGDLKLEDPAPNATSIKFTFWPRRSWQEPVRLLSMRTPYDYLADLSQAFATHIQASLAPSLSSSCEIRPEMDDGNYRCSFDFHQRGSKQPLPIPSKLLSVMVDGGVVSKLMCAGLRPQSGTLCSRLIADVEVYESKARLTAKLQPPISNAMEASAVAHDEIELHGPARTCTPSMLSSIGLPSHLSQRLCISSLQLACVGPAPNATLGPRMQLQLAEEALSAGDARAALQAALSALRGAKTCITYLSTTNTQNLEIMLRSFGIRATVDWQLTGHTQSANDVAVSCVRYARGDRDTEVWSSRCRKTLIAFGVVKNAVDVVNVVFDAHPWDDVLHDRSGVAHFAPSLSAVSKAIAMLPTSWQHGLDADGTEEARRWTMELSIAGCLARAESAKTERNQTLAMNLTLGSCATALSILEVAMKRWMPVTAFKASVVTWQIRIYIIRAEILFAAEEYKQAMREVMKALGLPNADEALDHDRVTDLLRRIVRARSETHGGTGGSGSSWDFSEDENDQETSYYEILGVERNATDAEVKRAYRQLALKWHPDKHTDDKEKAEAMFISITEAYEYIIADTERQRRSGQPQAPPKGHMSEESTTEEENVDEETRETDSDEGDAQKDNEAENRKSDSSHEDEGSGHSWDPLSRVALPRHCCLPAPRR